MFETAIKLTELPWASILTLAAGYCGYFIAHQGNRSHHQAADVTFASLAFGFWGLLTFQILSTSERFGVGTTLASVGGFAASIILGAAWSSFGRRVVDWLLRAVGATLSDDCPSAWAALGRDPSVSMSEISVKLSTGEIYRSKPLSRFSKEPNGPCTFGANGDLIMYVTHISSPGGNPFVSVDPNVINSTSYEATYIPRDQIMRVDIQQSKRPSWLRRAIRRLRRSIV